MDLAEVGGDEEDGTLGVDDHVARRDAHLVHEVTPRHAALGVVELPSGHVFHLAAHRIEAQDVAEAIGDEELPVAVEGQALGLADADLVPQALVAAELEGPGAHRGRDDARVGVHPAHAVVEGVGDVEVAVRRDGDAVGVHRRLGGRQTITDAAAGDRLDLHGPDGRHQGEDEESCYPWRSGHRGALESNWHAAPRPAREGLPGASDGGFRARLH